MQTFDWQKYILAFVITSVIFSIAFFVSDSISQKRIAEIDAIENKIAIDILSSETQFDLLAESSCEDIQRSALSKELNTLAQKLDFTEQSRGEDDEEVVRLKKYYSLLQAKDYLLMKKIGDKCKTEPVFVLYFYSNKGDCPDCRKEGFVLTKLREEYPKLRIYAFDYNLDLSAIDTLKSLYNLDGELPVIVVNDTVSYGFHDFESLEKIIPDLQDFEADEEELEATALSATSTEESLGE